MDVSVIVPVYNAAALINRCLDSIFAQTGGYEVEVICVDDGSTDNSVELIKARGDSRIKILSQPNSGPAKARNTGMALATAQLMAYLDADDYWMPDFFSRTIPFINQHPECVAVTVGQRHITTSGSHISPKFLGSLEEYDDVPKNDCVLDDYSSFWSKHRHVCTGSIVMRTEIAKKVGGQREDLRSCEDLEFWAVLSTQGKFGFIPEVLFVSDGGKVTKTQGWIAKMQRRWDMTPEIDQCLSRLKVFGALDDNFAMKAIVGNVGSTLIYDKMLTTRWKMARRESLIYGKYLRKGFSSKIINLAKHTLLTWWLLKKYIHYKEYSR